MRGGSAINLFYRRIGWLFLFGALHGWLLWCFDVLRFYALWALLLPLFVRMPLRRLLAVALSTAVVFPAVIAGVRGLYAGPTASGPAYDSLALAAFSNGDYSEVLSANWKYDWYLTNSIGQLGYQLAVFGRLLLGLYAARAFDLGNLDAHRAVLKSVLLAGATVGSLGNGAFAFHFLAERARLLPAVSAEARRRERIPGAHPGLRVRPRLLVHEPTLEAHRPLAGASRPDGSHVLSAPDVFGIWLFYGFMPGPHLMGKIGPAWIALVCVVGYWVQVGLAHVWMRRFRFGPAEWLWRTLTYGQVQPLKLRPDRC